MLNLVFWAANHLNNFWSQGGRKTNYKTEDRTVPSWEFSWKINIGGNGIQRYSKLVLQRKLFICSYACEKGKSVSFMSLFLWSNGKFYPISRSLLVLYRNLWGKVRNLTYSLTFKLLMLIVWSNLPGTSMFKSPSIIPTNLHWRSGIKIRNCYVQEKSIGISLVLVARLMEICILSIPLSKTFKLTWRKIRSLILDIFNLW